MPNPVIHFEISGKDPVALQQYYRDLFAWGVTAASAEDTYGLVSAEEQGAGIGGGIGSVMEGAEPYVTFYVEVEDIQASLDRAAELGGEVLVPVSEVPGMVTFAMFKDPEGNAIGLAASETPAAAE